MHSMEGGPSHETPRPERIPYLARTVQPTEEPHLLTSSTEITVPAGSGQLDGTIPTEREGSPLVTEPVRGMEMRKPTAVEATAAERRARFYARVGEQHDTHSIHTERVEHYARALGLTPQGDYIILPSRDAPGLYEAMGELIGVPRTPPDSSGFTVPGTGQVILFRNTSRGAHSAENIEHTLVHEHTGHNTQKIGRAVTGGVVWEMRPARFAKPEYGFASGKFGHLLEEGFARIVDAGYAQAIAPNPPNTTADAGDTLYRYPDRNAYNAAGMTWDVLTEADPQIIDLLIAARGNDEAMAELTATVNGMERNLFRRLMGITRGNGSYEQVRTNFDRGLEIAMRAAGVTRAEVQDISDNGHATQWFAQKIQAYSAATGYDFHDPRE